MWVYLKRFKNKKEEIIQKIILMIIWQNNAKQQNNMLIKLNNDISKYENFMNKFGKIHCILAIKMMEVTISFFGDLQKKKDFLEKIFL